MNREEAAKAAARKAFESDPYSFHDAEDYARDWLLAEHAHQARLFCDLYRDEWNRLHTERNRAAAEQRQGML